MAYKDEYAEIFRELKAIKGELIIDFKVTGYMSLTLTVEDKNGEERQEM